MDLHVIACASKHFTVQREAVQAAGEMDVETMTTATGKSVRDRADLLNKAGLLPNAVEGVEKAQEIKVQRVPQPLNRALGTDGPTLHKGEGVLESPPLEACGVSPEGGM